MTTKVPLLALAGWTMFVWTNRIRNIVADEGWVTHWRMAVSVLFVAVSVVLAVTVFLSRFRTGVGRLAERSGVGLAVVGSGWWIVRDLGIVLGDHSVGFKIVHTLLAVVTVILSLWVVRSVRRSSGLGYIALGESR